MSNIADQINDAKWKNGNKVKDLVTELSTLYIIILAEIFSSSKVYEILLFMRIKRIFVIFIIQYCELFTAKSIQNVDFLFRLFPLEQQL